MKHLKGRGIEIEVLFKKEKPTFLEKVIFFNPMKTYRRRKKIYDKQERVIESFIGLCDELFIKNKM